MNSNNATTNKEIPSPIFLTFFLIAINNTIAEPIKKLINELTSQLFK